MSQTSQFYTKAKVDEKLATKQDNLTIDTQLSTTSTNPVQNKAVTTAINSKQPNLTPGTGISIQNNIISSTLVIDNELSTTSTNPAQNKVITEELNTKAVLGAFNGGGTGVDYADLANNLIASKGLEVESYFTFEKTGGEQASAIETGNGTLKNLYGKTEKSENQIVLADIAETTQNNVKYKLQGGALILNGTPDTTFALTIGSVNADSSEYFGAFHYGTLENGSVNVSIQSGSSRINSWTNASHPTPVFIGSAVQENKTYSIIVDITRNVTYTNYQIRPMLVKGSTAPAEWKQGYEGLKHTHITGLKSTGINLWNEEWEVGSYTDGNPVASTNMIRSKYPNKIEVVASQPCYFKTGGYTMVIHEYDINGNFLEAIAVRNEVKTLNPLCDFVRFRMQDAYGTTYNHDICINFSNPNFNGNYYPSEQDTLDIDFEGNGVGSASDEINVEEGKKYVRFGVVDLGTLDFNASTSGDGVRIWQIWAVSVIANLNIKPALNNGVVANIICSKYVAMASNSQYASALTNDMTISVASNGYITLRDSSTENMTASELKTYLSGVPFTYELNNPIVTDVEIPKDTIKVWNGGSMEALGTEIPVGTKIFYQKNIKSFVEAFGEAIDWNPDRIERLAKLSITPEYVNISLNPSQQNAYAVAQVYNATFTIVISTALTGTADSSITFQDSEIDLSSFETQPAESIYDMDGKKVSEEPTTPDCNIASFVGRSYNGIVLWSLLHSGVNKVKVRFEQAIPLDSTGNGKLDCRASLIL